MADLRRVTALTSSAAEERFEDACGTGDQFRLLLLRAQACVRYFCPPGECCTLLLAEMKDLFMRGGALLLLLCPYCLQSPPQSPESGRPVRTACRLRAWWKRSRIRPELSAWWAFSVPGQLSLSSTRSPVHVRQRCWLGGVKGSCAGLTILSSTIFPTLAPPRTSLGVPSESKESPWTPPPLRTVCSKEASP